MKELKHILFLDIETVSASKGYNDLDERLRSLWDRKASFLKRDEDITEDELYFQRAGIYAEFGKVITIALGYFHEEEGQYSLRVKAIYDHNEKVLLEKFSEVLSKIKAEPLKLCAHNGREFDFPFLSRRMLINGLPLPTVLDLAGKKPWEINHIDTMDMWKFGDWKHYTSLDLLAAVFNIKSSKTDMKGSDVNHVYYETGDLQRIAEYCIQDVIVTAQLFAKLKNLSLPDLEIVNTPAN